MPAPGHVSDRDSAEDLRVVRAPGPTGVLGPVQRARDVRRLVEEEFDILVIGGGVVGAGAALDAATRGLRVALVEARDWAAGTSSRSSKLVHGGLRYLEQLEFGLVREALRERALILDHLCPHLAQPVPFLFPLTRRVWERAYVGAGIALYDVLGGRHGMPAHKHLSRRGARKLFPALRKDSLVGAIRYYDGQIDDARHTMSLVRTAAAHGASCVSSARVTDLLREDDRVVGATVRDLEAGEEFAVRARHTINAGGVWTDDVQRLAGGRGQISVRASKGIHVVVPRDRIQATVGLISKTASSVLFVIPWGSHWLIGTTDTDWNLSLDHPAASRRDIDYLLEQANELLAAPLTHEDVQGVYAGLRPLLSGDSDASSELSREHAVVTPVAGLTLVAGGKYTTYRVMARDAVDAAALSLGVPAAPCCTDRTPLVGADGYQALWNNRYRLGEQSGLHVARIEHLLHRYGSLVHELLAIVAAQPELGDRVEGAAEHLAVEFVYGARCEGALHLDDLLARRTHLSIETYDRGVDAAPHVAALVAQVLGWSDADVQREVEHYRARVAAERESQEQPDDRTADAARLGAPDVRIGSIRP